MITYGDNLPMEGKVRFMLDLGRVQDIGRIDFWPAAALPHLALPSMGFPEELTIEMSADSGFQSAKVLKVDHASKRMYRENVLTVIGEGYDAQYIRITVDEPSQYKGKRILGLGEISISEFGEVLSSNCKITAQGIPEKEISQLPKLVDGYSRQRRILPQQEWIMGLSKRRPLDRRLAMVEYEIEQAWETWRRIKWNFAILGAGIVLAGFLGWLVLLRRIRKRGIDRLKLRITRDLHDEVGSSLGSIALAANRMENDASYSDVKQGLSELSLLASEASVSLREVVWVIDQGVIRLPELIQKLVERTERVLYGMEVTVDVLSNCPDRVVPLTFKRHLVMFFKEAVYNCARHSGATKVTLSVSAADGQLCIRLDDNGCGFNRADQKSGWGLDSMKKRAQELGGAMEIISQIGKGTTVVLTVPLSSLQGSPDYFYKTSN